MNNLVVFTHIPKTSGTSFLKGVVEENITAGRMYQYHRLPQFINSKSTDFDFVHGHVPYGPHMFTRRPVDYVTFLRDPVDRAISFYYFVQQGGENPETRHPLCDYAESVSLKGFYENPVFHNHQTRLISGYISHKFYKYLNVPFIKKRILAKAKSNLEFKYKCFGLLEHRDTSLKLFREKMGWKEAIEVPHQKKTTKRKKVSDIDVETLKTIQKAHDLDIELYQHALKIFPGDKH